MTRIIRSDHVPVEPADIISWVTDHKGVHDFLLTMEDQFEAKQMILLDPAAAANRPDNRLVHNYPGYISTVNIGYFMGKPVKYSGEVGADQFMEELQDVFDYNDEQDENMTLAREASIKGVAYEILYVDDQAKVRFAATGSENIILVRDNTIESNILFAIRYWLVDNDKDDTYRLDLYDQVNRTQYEFKTGSTTITIVEGPTAHFFEDVPIVEYPNNEERMGDFERVLSLIYEYDKSQSNTANDFDDFTDAYLVLRNMSGTEEAEILAMKKHKVLLLGAEDGAEWLTKTMQSEAGESFKDRLAQDIHKFSMTPNLTDESFAGNISGVALEFKLWGLEQMAAQKERKFKKGLQRRIELLCQHFSIRSRKYDWRDISITFTRNMPMNLPDLVKMVVDLRGILSNETLLSQLPFLSDAKEEILKLEKESVDKVDLSDTPVVTLPPGNDTAIEGPVGEPAVVESPFSDETTSE